MLLSWVLAITVAPLFCHLLFKSPDKDATNTNDEGYNSRLYQGYKTFLMFCLNHKVTTVVTAIILLVLAVIEFSMVRSGFFPNSTTPMFYIDYWRAEGSDIRALKEDMLAISKKLKQEK